MNDQGIPLERNPSPMKLEVMGVENWGIWKKEKSTFPWTYHQQETCYITRGRFIVTPEGGEPMEFRCGDLITFPAGMKCTCKRVFGLVIDFGTSQSPKSTRPLTTYLCPSRPGHQALRNNFASSLLLRTWLPMTGRRVRRPTLFSLWRKARRENSAASRLLGSTSLRFALHAWQREILEDVEKYFDFQ